MKNALAFAVALSSEMHHHNLHWRRVMQPLLPPQRLEGLLAEFWGGTLATSTVTLLVSHALGSAALALGLVSAPLWPVFLAGGIGVAAGGGIWLALKKFFSSDPTDSELLAMQIGCGQG